MHTLLAQQAQENLNIFKKYCTEEEFKELESGVKTFDTDLRRFGFPAIQAKVKLNKIKEMNFSTFRAVMYVYFGKDIVKIETPN